jgi:outer membrane protein OmpA-like peptidoglycan-associated protein
MPSFSADRSTSQAAQVPSANQNTKVSTSEFDVNTLSASGNVSEMRRSISTAAATRREHGTAPSTINLQTGSIEATKDQVTGTSKLTRTTTIVPTPAQDKNPVGFEYSAVHHLPRDAKGSTGYAGVAAAAPSATLETMPPQVKKTTNSYVQIDREQLELKVKAFREQLSLAQSKLSTDVKYDFAKNQMDSKTRAALGEVAKAIEMLDGLPGLENHQLTIHGHTDSKAGLVRNEQGQMVPFDNQKLSEQRANDLRDALIGMGVNPDRVVAVGHGASDPLAPNKINIGGRMVDNPAGRARNRRAELGFSMDQGQYDAYLLNVESRFERESRKNITEETTKALPRPVVEHLKTTPGGDMMASSMGFESSEARAAREAREAAAREARDRQARRLADALEQVCKQNVDLKISEYNGEPSTLALRVDKDSKGNYLVSVFNPESSQALQTSKYTPSGFVSERSGYGSSREISSSAINDGLLKWAARQR